ncbi:autophagy-related protein 27 [Auriculariales sp. MPI-PUGE-AT-0066]|nr:autophagy-related protein 27 [Auriculariales sp. MPI-PUGE-AT-0066]
MRFSRLPLPFLLILGVFTADDTCDVDLGNGVTFKLPGGVHTATREKDQPPSKRIESVSFNLCAELPKQDDVPESDRCSSGTAACYTISAKKGESTTITQVIPVGKDWDKSVKTALADQQGLSIVMEGSEYAGTKQSFAVTFKCAKEDTKPQLDNYDEKAGRLSLIWSLPQACTSKIGEPVDDSPSKPASSSGLSLGYFFLLFFLVGLAYFGIGAYYNYTTYAKTGWDAVPHKIFLQEIPYLISSLAQHLCSVIRPRTRSGYVNI